MANIGGGGGGGGGSRAGASNGMSQADVFSEFFGSSIPSTGTTGVSVTTARNVDDIFPEFFGYSNPSGGGGGVPRASSSSVSNIPTKRAAIERILACSLEELYKGTTKKLKISRNITDPLTGRLTSVEEMLEIVIKPGWKKGTKITFPGKGNEQGSDLVFIVDEKPHDVFERDDNDLIVTQKVSLVDALTGYMAQITTIDGRELTIHIDSIISPGYERVVKGGGMPFQKEPFKKGNLRIKFNIKFPTRLTAEEKAVIRQNIPSSRFL